MLITLRFKLQLALGSDKDYPKIENLTPIEFFKMSLTDLQKRYDLSNVLPVKSKLRLI